MYRKLTCGLLAAAGCLAVSSFSLAQVTVAPTAPRAGGRPAPPADGLRRDGDGAVETQWEPTHPSADPRNLDGLWEVPRPSSNMRDLDGKVPTFTPTEAVETQRRIDAEKNGEPIADASTYCFPHGVPRMTNAPFPIRFAYAPGMIVMLYEVNHNVRYVHMNATAPANTPRTFLGYSVGHWDGDTLVVETDHFNNRTLMDSHTTHGDKLKVTERFTKVKTGKLNNTDLKTVETMEDPDHWVGPFTMTRNFAFRSDLVENAGWEGLTEYACEENNRNVPDAFGVSQAVLQK